MGAIQQTCWARTLRGAVCSILLTGLAASGTVAQDTPWEFHVLLDTSNSMKGKPSVPEARDWNSTLAEVQRQLSLFCDDLPRETKVYVYAFDTEFRMLTPAEGITIFEDADRLQVRGIFQQLDARNARTHLWTAVDHVLERASQSAQSTPGRKLVRILVYTDGDDNEENGPGPRAVFEKYHDLIQGQANAPNGFKVKLITLGFDLKANERAIVTHFGGEVDRAGRQLTPLFPNFIWLPAEPEVGQSIQFVDRSTGLIRDYLWRFGDGKDSIARRRSPTYVFQRPGTFTVRLDVVSPTNKQETLEQSITIRPRQLVEPQFRISQSAVTAGAPVTFVNESSGPVQSYYWEFGDTASSNLEHPTHIYTRAGSYAPRLIAIGPHGEKKIFESREPIRVESPQLEILGPQRVMLGDPLALFARFNGEFDAALWDFGDGSPRSNELDPVHTFQKAGSFVVRAAVRGPNGETQAMKEITVVGFERPAADFSYFPTTITINERVQFFAHWTGAVEQVEWDFGDGSTADPSSAEGSRDTAHVFTQTGTYQVRLKIRGPGGEAACTKTIAVEGITPPKVDFDFFPSQVTLNQPVQFVSRLQGVVKSVAWQFGDGSTDSTDRDPHHTFEQTGTFRVTLEGLGPGGQDEISKEISVLGPPPPEADFAAPDRVKVGQIVHFRNVASGLIDEFSWDFADGSAIVEQADPQHAFDQPGAKMVKLVVRGPGGIDQFEKEIIVDPLVPPMVDIGGPATAIVDQPIQFYARWEGEVRQLRWEFGDGKPPREETDPQHCFREPGRHLVTLTASGPEGASSKSMEIEVRAIESPTADFVIGAATPASGDEVMFTDVSTGPIESATWDFGDGSEPITVHYADDSISALRAVPYTFQQAGSYQVQLTSSGPGGQTQVSHPVEIVSPQSPTQARFVVEEVDRNLRQYRFLNTTSGPFQEAVLKFGDGSKAVTTTGADALHHTYQVPGKYAATLTVRTADGGVSHFNQEVHVRGPFPWWIVWMAAGIVTLTVLLLWAIRGHRRRQEERLFNCPTGIVSYKPRGGEEQDWREVAVVTSKRRFEFPLEPAASEANGNGHWSAALTKTGQNDYSLELLHESEPVDQWPIDPGGEVRSSEFVFRYTA